MTDSTEREVAYNSVTGRFASIEEVAADPEHTYIRTIRNTKELQAAAFSEGVEAILATLRKFYRLSDPEIDLLRDRALNPYAPKEGE